MLLAECYHYEAESEGVVAMYLSQGFINYFRMLEMIIGEEIELVKKIANVDTAKRIHL